MYHRTPRDPVAEPDSGRAPDSASGPDSPAAAASAGAPVRTGLSSRTAVRLWGHALTVAGAASIAVLGWRHRGLADDGTIFLRTVRQILAGNGPVVNTGERVEANTSTLWQWILVLVGAVTPGDLGFAAVVTGLVLTTAGFAFALDATRRLVWSGTPRPLLPFGVLVPIAVTPFWDFATAGLDTGLMFCWLGAAWWLLVRARELPGGRELFAHAVWLGAGYLVRPDLAPIAVVFLAATLWITHASWRAALVRCAAAAALPLAYTVFRAGYYGILVPMPALTKEAGATEVERGLAYVRDFAEPYHLWVPLLPVAVALAMCALRRARHVRGTGGPGDVPDDVPGTGRAGGDQDRARDRKQDQNRNQPPDRSWLVPWVPVLAAAPVLAYVVRLGGDYMHGRMLLPVVFLLVAPVLVVALDRVRIALACVMAVWALAVAGPWNPDAYHGHDPDVTARVRNNDIVLTSDHNPDHMRDWVAAFPGLRISVAAGLAEGRPVFVRIGGDGAPVAMYPLHPRHGADVSIPGGYLGVTGRIVPLDQRIVELWGLANTLGAHMEYMPDWRSRGPGHRKLIDDVWLLALELDPAVAAPPPGYPAVSPQALAAARRVLGCGKVAELLASVEEPLTLRRFWDNLTGAPGRTTLRIPRDPFAAEQRFC